MEALITACGRYDLLQRTLESLPQVGNIFTVIHDDFQSRLGQHKSIEIFLKKVTGKYYLHLEEDWIFENKYDWIMESIAIMESDSKCIKVLCRDGSPHPHEARYRLDGRNVPYDYLNPWTGPDGIEWHGFSWNPGITRVDLLKSFIPFPKWEQELAKQIYNKGYHVAQLYEGVSKHIGDGRSTH